MASHGPPPATSGRRVLRRVVGLFLLFKYLDSSACSLADWRRLARAIVALAGVFGWRNFAGTGHAPEVNWFPPRYSEDVEDDDGMLRKE